MTMRRPPIEAVNDGTARLEAATLGAARDERRRVGVRRFLDRIAVIALTLIVWEVVVRVGWVHEFFISRPSRIVVDLYTLFATGYIWPHLLITLYETLGGLVLGTLFGMVTGFGAGLSQRFADAIEPVIIAFNSMPRVAIAPLFVIWFGFGPESKIALAAIVVYFVVFFNTFAGMRSIDPILLHNIRTMGGTTFDGVRFVSFPYCLVWVFTATKTAISMSLIAAVVGEFVGSQSGLGWIMVQASGTMNTTRLFSCMIVLSIFGSIMFFIVKAIEDRALRWRPN